MHDKTTLSDKLVAAARATYENVTVVTVVGCVVALTRINHQGEDLRGKSMARRSICAAA